MAQRSLLFSHSSKDITQKVNVKFTKNNTQSVMEVLTKICETYDPHQIEELILEDHNIGSIDEDLKAKLEQFIHLESLSLNRCRLNNLKNLPKLKRLQRFTADCNELKLRHIDKLSIYPDLISLSLISNQITGSTTQLIEQLQPLTSLVQLNMYGNPMTLNNQELHQKIKSLQLVDGLDRSGKITFFEGDEDSQQLELSRNDGEDLRTASRLIKEQNQSQFEFVIGGAVKKQPPAPQPKKMPKKVTTTSTPSVSGNQFKREMHDEQDEDDEEFNPNKSPSSQMSEEDET